MLLARTRSGHCLGGGWTRAGIALCVSALPACVPAVDADVFHLRNGGTVEGQLVATEGDVYRVRTAAGLIGLPVSAVERTEAGSTALDEYDRRVRETPDTPADQTTLGLWCAEHGLRTESKRHLQRAVALDPDYEAAQRALGFVRVGTLWVIGATISGPTCPHKYGTSCMFSISSPSRPACVYSRASSTACATILSSDPPYRGVPGSAPTWIIPTTAFGRVNSVIPAIVAAPA